MDKGGGDEHACTEVSREEEEFVGDGYRGKAPDDDGEGAGRSAQEEYEEQCKHVSSSVVVLVCPFASARRPVLLVSTAQFGL